MQQGMMMVGPGGVPGGYFMMPQGMGGMPPQMQSAAMAGMQGAQGQGHGQDGQQQMMMMASMPAHGMSPSIGGPQASMMGVSAISEIDSKGRNVAALRSGAQPKQGAGGWHGGDRRGGRPAAGGGPGMDMQGMPFVGGPSAPPSAVGVGSSGAAVDSQNNSKMAARSLHPKQPAWADVLEVDTLDPETMKKWNIRSFPGGQGGRGMNSGTPQGAKHGMQPMTTSSPAGRGKAQQGSQRWVEKEPAVAKGQHKGGNQAWAPKAPLVPASVAPQTLGAGPPPPAKGGGKKQSKREKEFNDWVSLRLQGQQTQSSHNSSTVEAHNDWSNEYGGGFDNSQDFDAEEVSGRRNGKKRAGGKGQAGSRDREKGGNKGKGKGKWRASG